MKLSLIGFALVAAASLLASIAVASAGEPTPTPTPTPSPTATPSPTPTPAALGSISGRVYIDVNANGVYDGPDVPGAGWPVFGVQTQEPPYPFSSISADGSYQLTGLQPASYTVVLSIGAIPAALCLVVAPFNWVGGEQDNFFCPSFPDLTTEDRTVDLGPGENVTGIDFPQVPPTGISGRLWLNGGPVPAATEAFVTVSGSECWQVDTSSEVTAAGITISPFTADLQPTTDAACIQGDIALMIGGSLAGESVSWSSFWSRQLSSAGKGGIGEQKDFMVPPFMGLSGRVIVQQGDTELDSDSLVADQTLVAAFVGSTVCGQATTKKLEDGLGRNMNLFGLIVPPEALKTDCGEEGSLVTLCIDGAEAQVAGPIGVVGAEIEPLTWTPGETVALTIEETDEPCPVALGLPPTGSQAPERAAGPPPRLLLIVGGAMVLAGATLLTLRRAASRARRGAPLHGTTGRGGSARPSRASG